MKISSALFFFRTGSYALLLVSMAHLIGHFGLQRPASETERKVIAVMKAYEKEVAGGSMSMIDLVDGLNLCYALFFLFAGIINLYLANTRSEDRELLKTISFLNASLLTAGLIISIIYFFWVPVVSFGVGAICFLIAGVRYKSERIANE